MSPFETAARHFSPSFSGGSGGGTSSSYTSSLDRAASGGSSRHGSSVRGCSHSSGRGSISTLSGGSQGLARDIMPLTIAEAQQGMPSSLPPSVFVDPESPEERRRRRRRSLNQRNAATALAALRAAAGAQQASAAAAASGGCSAGLQGRIALAVSGPSSRVPLRRTTAAQAGAKPRSAALERCQTPSSLLSPSQVLPTGAVAALVPGNSGKTQCSHNEAL